MHLKTHSRSVRGFTMVEIMIVVLIIALLASLAVPTYLRARQRSQATRVLNDVRILDHAVEQWASENIKKSSEAVAFSDIKPFIKATRSLSETNGLDIFGNSFLVGPTVEEGANINSDTFFYFESSVVPLSFWGPYAPLD